MGNSVMLSHCTGAILTGGKSSRFGSNKAAAEIEGVRVTAHIRDQLSIVLKRVLLIGNDAKDIDYLNLPVFPDVYREKGPLGGIHAALCASFSEWTLVTPCDLPLFSYNLVIALSQFDTNCDVICFSMDNMIEPMPAFFNKRVLRLLSILMRNQVKSILDLYRFCRLHIIPVESCGSFVNPGMLTNCNTPGDLLNAAPVFRKLFVSSF